MIGQHRVYFEVPGVRSWKIFSSGSIKAWVSDLSGQRPSLSYFAILDGREGLDLGLGHTNLDEALEAGKSVPYQNRTGDLRIAHDNMVRFGIMRPTR
jgi:hypothetical protein